MKWYFLIIKSSYGIDLWIRQLSFSKNSTLHHPNLIRNFSHLPKKTQHSYVHIFIVEIISLSSKWPFFPQHERTSAHLNSRVVGTLFPSQNFFMVLYTFYIHAFPWVDKRYKSPSPVRFLPSTRFDTLTTPSEWFTRETCGYDRHV